MERANLKTEEYKVKCNKVLDTRIRALSPDQISSLARKIKKAGGKLHPRTIAKPGLSGLPSTLVAIRTTGTRTPLFLVHPVGGGVQAYYQLAKYLDLDQPVYAFQNVAAEDQVNAAASIQAMAAGYVDALCTVQPRGPYLLGGWSMGGMIAFEMAAQLREKGKAVLMVLMIDAPARLLPQRPSLNPNNFESGAPDLAAQLSRLVEGDVLTSLDEATLKSMAQNVLRNQNAMLRYHPRDHDCQVVLLRASEALPEFREGTGEIFDDPAFGWQAYCRQPIAVHFVPGTHFSMMAEPHIQATAGFLEQRLGRLLKQTNPPE